jgi:hypothetical protein
MQKFSTIFSNEKGRTYRSLLLAIIIFLLVYFIYQNYAYLLGRSFTESAYWDALARSFSQGKLYLINPSQTFDLTFYQGHWYVPEPPLPALLMLPLILLSGGANPILFSIFFSAINCVLVFLILDQLSFLGWIKTPRIGILLLVLLFAFGTPHWWVGMDGGVWFVSQIVAVTFIALAVLFALKSWSPWLVGLSLGAAIASRPTVFMIWLFLLAILAQQMKDKDNKVEGKPLVMWAFKSLIPIGLIGIGLLAYNYFRFNNFLNFGYSTINGSLQVVTDVQKYGMFNFHFIPINLFTMFLKLPAIQTSQPYLSPSLFGMSIFATTPAFFYLIHHYEKRLWIMGAWVSVLLSIGVLALYSNTGYAEFGYRYVLDFIVPLLCLLATTIKGKISILFILLILVSVMINEYGAFWFIRYYNG